MKIKIKYRNFLDVVVYGRMYEESLGSGNASV